jgi:hypothetical protein
MEAVPKTAAAWRDQDRSFPEDELLRWDEAFSLESRPAKGEPIWKRRERGTLHTQTDAVSLQLRRYGCKAKNGRWSMLATLYTRDEAVLLVLGKLKSYQKG